MTHDSGEWNGDDASTSTGGPGDAASGSDSGSGPGPGTAPYWTEIADAAMSPASSEAADDARCDLADILDRMVCVLGLREAIRRLARES